MSGLNNPTAIRPFVKIVMLKNELYLTSQPASVAPMTDGRMMKCK